MDVFFFLLSLTCLVLLIIGLIKPRALSKIFKKEPKRTKVLLVFGSFTFLFFIMCGVVADSPQPIKQNTNNQQESIINKNEEIVEDEQKDSEPAIEKEQSKPETIVEKKPTENQPKDPITTIQSEPTPIPEPEPIIPSYQQIFTFSGNGAKNSEPFTVIGSRFKIAYNCHGDLCQAFLNNASDGSMKDLIMNTMEEAVDDETIIYGSGEYFIQANTIGTYTFTVYDYR